MFNIKLKPIYMSIKIASYLFIYFFLFSCYVKEAREKGHLTYLNYKNEIKKKEKNIIAIGGYTTFSFLKGQGIFYKCSYYKLDNSWDLLFSGKTIKLNGMTKVYFVDNMAFRRVNRDHIKEEEIKNFLLEEDIFHEKSIEIKVFESNYSLRRFPPIKSSKKYTKKLLPIPRVFIFNLSDGKFVKLKILSYESGVYSFKWAFI